MDDPDPLIVEERVPSYDIIKQKLKEIDNTIIIYRIYYLLTTFTFRFQLIKKNQMCVLEIPRVFLEGLTKDDPKNERKLTHILNLKIEDVECWNDIR